LGMSKPRPILRAVTLTVASRHPYDCREFGGGDEIGNGGQGTSPTPGMGHAEATVFIYWSATFCRIK